MTSDEIRGVVITALTRVAPELDPASVRPRVPFRDQFDLDSIDFLNFVIALHVRLGVEIPEADYRRLQTIDDAVAYLGAKLD
jgi:acyl carrier protein